MIATRGWAAYDPTSPLRSFSFQRRDPGPDDVQIEVLFCGVCHSDIHQVRDEWGGSIFPMVPGHEVVGRVVAVGANVKKLAPGDHAGVGCMVDSCRTCPSCAAGEEQFCREGASMTYNGYERDKKTPTYGGYSTQIVVDQAFALKVAAKDRLDTVAPLLCAGITTWSPLRRHGVGKGHKLAVLGLGGLGHMGVKLGVALGAEVTLISSSPGKKADAQRLGAHEFLLGNDDAAMARSAGRFDFLLDTVSAEHDLARFANLLGVGGTMIVVGAPPKPLPLPAFSLIMRRRQIVGSLIGGIAETQEMLDFCAEKGIGADVETIPVQQIDAAYERMLKNDVRYRFVVDAKSI